MHSVNEGDVLVAPAGLLQGDAGQVRNGLDFRTRSSAGLVVPAGFIVERYFDRVYLCLPDSGDERARWMERFFDAVADDYENLIDVPRNRANIAFLMESLAASHGVRADDRVVDFGCGTGLAAGIADTYGWQLIGVDPCPNMRRIARSRGMAVVSPGGLATMPRESIAGGVASYVFHLLPHTQGFELLWSRLRPGAWVVGNFHKDQNVEAMVEVVRRLGGESRKLANSDPLHGPTLALVKGAQ